MKTNCIVYRSTAWLFSCPAIMASIFPLFILLLEIVIATKTNFVSSSGKWESLGTAESAEFTVPKRDRLLLVEAEVRSPAVRRFVMIMSSGPIFSVVKYHDKDSNDPPYPLAATIIRPRHDTKIRIDVQDRAAAIFVRVTEIRSTVPNYNDWGRRVRNLILVKTKIPHFLHKSVCTHLEAQPAAVRCRNYNTITDFLKQSTKPGSSISIGKLDKDSSKDNRIIQIDISGDGSLADVRIYKSRGPITKRMMMLCELDETELPRSPIQSVESDCPMMIFDGNSEG